MEEAKEDGKKRNEPPVELHSPAVQEIFGRPPRWMVRWGITVTGLVVAVMVAGSALLKLPDVVSSSIRVTTWNLPAHVTARSAGRIDSLFVGDGAAVAAGDVLMSLWNPARYEEVERARSWAEGWRGFCEGRTDSIPSGVYPTGLELGSLQTAWQSLSKAADDYICFMQDEYYVARVDWIERQLRIQERIVSRMDCQVNLSNEELHVQERWFATDSALYARNAVSLSEYESSRKVILQSRQGYVGLQASADNARLSAAQLEQSIWETKQEERDRRQALVTALGGAWGEWQAQLEAWRQEYLCIAPVSGRVVLSGYWQANQQVAAGDVLLSVVPEGEVRMSGRVKLPMQGAGKVKAGQEVHVKFDAYPYMEYGMVTGMVAGISAVPVKEGEGTFRMVEVSLPDSLVTNYGKRLEFMQEMPGTAEIVTGNLSLLDRILAPIKFALMR